MQSLQRLNKKKWNLYFVKYGIRSEIIMQQSILTDIFQVQDNMFWYPYKKKKWNKFNYQFIIHEVIKHVDIRLNIFVWMKINMW